MFINQDEFDKVASKLNLFNLNLSFSRPVTVTGYELVRKLPNIKDQVDVHGDYELILTQSIDYDSESMYIEFDPLKLQRIIL